MNFAISILLLFLLASSAVIFIHASRSQLHNEFIITAIITSLIVAIVPIVVNFYSKSQSLILIGHSLSLITLLIFGIIFSIRSFRNRQ